MVGPRSNNLCGYAFLRQYDLMDTQEWLSHWGAPHRGPGCAESDIILINISMTYYDRHLPHWQPLGRPIFLTWRLFGSLPEEVIAELQRHRNLSEGKTFLMPYGQLDIAHTGPRCLTEPSLPPPLIPTPYSRQHDLPHPPLP